MMAIGPAVVTASFPATQRGRALGAVGTVVAIGLTAGPPLGGLIVSSLSWRWVFLVNLPVGLAGALWALRTLPRGGGAAGGPLLDLSVFRDAVFSWGLLAGFLSYAAMFTQTLLTPFLLARVLGLSTGTLGIRPRLGAGRALGLVAALRVDRGPVRRPLPPDCRDGDPRARARPPRPRGPPTPSRRSPRGSPSPGRGWGCSSRRTTRR